MRVITGSARGRRLLAPKGATTRPTSDRVKGAMMSAIQFEIEGANVLDLFAGSGQLGLEALSRGARFCSFVDSRRECDAVIRDNLAHTGLQGRARVHQADVAVWLKTAAGPYDIAFLDPPYEEGWPQKCLPAVAALMRDSGAILCEVGAREALPERAGEFYLAKEYRHGKTRVALYRGARQEETQS